MHVLKRRFEVIGIPRHLWSDEKIKKIGECIGDVKEIHFSKELFDIIKLSIFININEGSSLCKTLGLREGNKVYQVHIHEISTLKGDTNNLFDEEYSNEDNRSTSILDIHLHSLVNVSIMNDVQTQDDRTPEFASGEMTILNSRKPKTNTKKTPLQPIHYDKDTYLQSEGNDLET